MKKLKEDANQGSLFSKHTLDNEDLSTLTGFAEAIIKQDAFVKELEEKLKEEKKKLLKMTDEDLPALMTEANSMEFTLLDGSKVTIKPQYGASIKVDNRPAAYEWLREHGHDDIIKNTISCQFGRGEDDLASSFKAFAEKEGYVPTQTEKIEPMSLRGFVKERVENGDEFPMELFGAYVGQRAVITKAKGAKNG
jgi:hypothetical protein|tara:strand:+ start:681 stop:1262 length:582 start_codon:yes stop_codon:yes gene_type:complete